jgi:hypothetical protein
MTGLGVNVGSAGVVAPSESCTERVSVGGTSFTGTVAGLKPLSVYVAIRSAAGTAIAHGVLQV